MTVTVFTEEGSVDYHFSNDRYIQIVKAYRQAKKAGQILDFRVS